MEKFGARLKTIRQMSGVSVEKLALSVGMTNDAVLKLESGTRGRTLEKLPRIAKALGCRIDDLFPEMDDVQQIEVKPVSDDGFEKKRDKDDDSLDCLDL